MRLPETVEAVTPFNERNGNHYRVRLRLHLDQDVVPAPPSANLVMFVPSRWDAFLPEVWTDEAWSYGAINWHSSPIGRVDLCWALPAEWCCWIRFWQREGIPQRKIKEIAGDWLVSSCELLMRRYYLGRLQGLENWPREWDEHKHDSIGIAAFYNSGSVPYRIYRNTFTQIYANTTPLPAAAHRLVNPATTPSP